MVFVVVENVVVVVNGGIIFTSVFIVVVVKYRVLNDGWKVFVWSFRIDNDFVVVVVHVFLYNS